MLEHLSILPELLIALFGAGWGLTAWRKRKERETHAAEMAEKEAEITSKLRESETKYTREALEIYTQQVVEPLRQQCERNTIEIARYQGAIDKAPSCRIFPDCIVVRELQSKGDNDNDRPA